MKLAFTEDGQPFFQEIARQMMRHVFPVTCGKVLEDALCEAYWTGVKEGLKQAAAAAAGGVFDPPRGRGGGK